MSYRTITNRALGLIRRNRGYVIAAVALVVFVEILERILEGGANRLDVWAYQLVVVRLRTPWLTPIMQSISELALPVVLLVVLLVIEAFAPGRRPGLVAAVNLALVTLLNLLLKEVVHRPRPDGFRLISETGYSFPSGHSMVAMAFYGLLAWMVWRYERDKVVKWLCMLGFALVICAIGFSRVYLGVHYATDVIAGFCVSLAWLMLYTRIVVPLWLDDEKERPDTKE